MTRTIRTGRVFHGQSKKLYECSLVHVRGKGYRVIVTRPGEPAVPHRVMLKIPGRWNEAKAAELARTTDFGRYAEMYDDLFGRV